MDQEERQQKSRWSSVASLLLFFLIVAGRPLASFLKQITGSVVINWIDLLPYAIGVLLLAVVVVAVVRAAGGGPRAPRLPTSSMTTSMPSHRDAPPLSAPRFDPVISPSVLLVGIVGLVILGAVGLFLVIQAAL